MLCDYCEQFNDDEFDCCNVCSAQYCLSCLCIEGQDGHLCRECSTVCNGCNMVITRDPAKSIHLIICSRCENYVCPDSEMTTLQICTSCHNRSQNHKRKRL